MKRIASLITALIMVFGLLAVTAGANITETAVDLTWGVDEIFYLGDPNNPNDFKFTVGERGNLTLSVDSNADLTIVELYNANGVQINPIKSEASTGRWADHVGIVTGFYWNDIFQKMRGTLTFDLIAGGTYYIRFHSWWHGNGAGRPVTINIDFMSRTEMERNVPLTATDALTVLLASTGLIELTAEQRERYGISGRATTADALRILRISVGLE
jgi:hypothetical protein